MISLMETGGEEGLYFGGKEKSGGGLNEDFRVST